MLTAQPRASDSAAPWPRLPKVYLPRHLLWADLDRSADAAITLVVAPAGAGKTLGVAGWLRQQNDDGVPRPRPRRWVDGDDTLGPEQLSSLLGETADGAPPRIVIDDAHLLPAATHRMLNERLNDDPDSMRLVMISRWDLPFTRLVPELLGNFSIVRGNVLQLSDTEAETLIIEHARTSSKQVIDGITQQARGWCAAVVLAARSVHASPPARAGETAFEEGTIGLGDRVASEVFASLSARARHLLLCTSAESTVTARTAAHLTQDPSAGETLADLESTGLLVTRAVPLVRDAETEDAYRIHPLLAEVVRRRLVAGGVDVMRARSTVVRAIRIDRTRGEAQGVLRRLEAVGAHEEMVVVLAEDGVKTVMRGDGDHLSPFARELLEHVETIPRTWFALAVEHWLDGEVPEAEHWLDKSLAESAAMSSEELACIGLMRARLGLEPLRAAADKAAEVVRDSHNAGREVAIHPQLLLELGITQSWLGDLAQAEQSLTAAIGLARTWGMPLVGADASSHLAMTEYMLGREAACGEIAEEATTLLARATPSRSHCPRRAFIRTRTALAASMARTARRPWVELAPIPDAALHPADLCTRFWMRIRSAHTTMSGHTVVRARQMFDEPLDLPGAFRLPDHLQVSLLINQAELAALATDRRSLGAAEAALLERGMTGEAALVKALHADLDGNRRLAAQLFETAAQQAVWTQPMVRAVALVARAELLHEMGDVETAFELLQQAAIETEVRQNAIPFLGWTRQGTPVQTMLARFPALVAQPWVGRIASNLEGMPSLATYFDQGTPRPSEKIDESAGPVPGLSARERDVLRELARGSTYADISAALFVSENTVKTHVSSLYAKLGASRRSQALAVARSLSLI